MKNKLLLIITIVILSFPKANFGQAPALGTAADFVLFSSVGAVTNVGIQYLTLLTGHVGANSGPISNFGNVDGNLYSGGPQSAACAADLLVAYNQLNATVATLFPGVLLGNGQTLTPGVHSTPGATTLNLDLTLDGLGNPNAVFIFKIQGPLSTNANSKVKLVNGAKACNVFWKVEGLVDMATGTKMRGTVIANNAAINMATGDTLEGRALSTNGAVTVSGIFAYTPIGCGSPVLLGPIAPNLASASCYAIFSSIGPVTNNLNPTIVRGDIGTNSGGTTGFNPLLVTGMIHPIPDASTASCATDLNTAYNYLNALPADIILMAPTLFGHNLVLTPHTYLIGPATTLTDTLYLDAQGSPNAVFVLKLNGALSTSVNSRVILRNGAQAKNVYWNINGATSINSNTIFNGTFIVAGAINLLNNATINGKILTINGAVNTDAVTVNIPVGTCGFNSPIVITEPTNQTACIGGSASFVVSATGNALTYQWRKGNVNLVNGGNISGVTTPTLTINPVTALDAATNYNVIVSGAYSPSDTSINVSLTVSASPTVMVSSNSPVCVGSPINLNASLIAGATYSWTGSNGFTSSLQNPVIYSATISNAGNYSLTVSGGSCTPTSTSIAVSVINCSTDLSVVKTVSNINPFIGNTVVFVIVATNNGTLTGTGVVVTDILQSGYTFVSASTTTGSYNNTTGLWALGNLNAGASQTLTITATVMSSGIYVNTATVLGNEPDGNMNNNVSTVETFPNDFFIPEGFSPNGDGINDLFVIRGINNFPNNNFTIFNRWGDKVFEAKPYQNTWDGTCAKGLRIGGDALPTGTYFYVIDLGDNSKIIKGTIYLNK